MIGAMQMPGMFAPQPQALPAQFTQHVQAAGQQMMEATGSPPGPSGGGPPPGAVVDNHRGTQYRVIAELGAGCFGTVCKVQRQSDGKVLAMKVQGLQSHAQLQEIQKEVGLLRQLRHDNVVSFFEDFGHQGGGGMTSACIIMEFCDGGTLQAHIESRKQQGFSDLRIAGYVAQLADGLEFIHSQNVTHRDLKSENVMMTSTMQLKISDFGCGKTLPQGATSLSTMSGGDMMIIPPEMAHRIQGVPAPGKVGPAYDMWGLGVILSEMVTLQVMRKDICRSKPLCLNKPAEDAILAYAQKVYGGRFHSLLTNLLQHSPARRPSAQQVRQEVRGFLRAESASAAADPHDLRRVAQELHVPESQLAEPWTHFQTADTQRQGAITVSQLKAVLTLLHIDISPQALMDRFDADGNGTMDFKEFATFWQQRDSVWMPTITPHRPAGPEQATAVTRVFGVSPADFQRLQAAFQEYDLDRSGTVTAFGMWTVLERAGIDMRGDTLAYLDRIGPCWRDRTFTFDDMLHWTKKHVDWATHTLRSSAAADTYQVGQRVHVKRSHGGWTPAVVQQVTNDAYVTRYTQADQGCTKAISFALAKDYLKPA